MASVGEMKPGRSLSSDEGEGCPRTLLPLGGVKHGVSRMGMKLSGCYHGEERGVLRWKFVSIIVFAGNRIYGDDENFRDKIRTL